jgi:hypothetical protein
VQNGTAVQIGLLLGEYWRLQTACDSVIRSASRYSDWLQARRLVHYVQTGSGAYPKGTGSCFTRGKAAGHLTSNECRGARNLALYIHYPTSSTNYRGFIPRWPGFSPRSGYIWLAVDKVPLGQFSSKNFCSFCQLSFHRMLHTHPPTNWSWNNRSTSGLGLTPPHKLEITSEKSYSPVFLRYHTDHIENEESKNSWIPSCVFYAAGICLQSRYLATISGILIREADRQYGDLIALLSLYPLSIPQILKFPCHC